MKTLRNKFWALLLITTVAFLSCKKEDRFSPNANASYKTSAADDRSVISRNDWKITTFQTGEMSEVKLFSEYIFKFTNDGKLLAYTSNNAYKGTWVMGRMENKLTLHFFDSGPLSQLNAEWRVLAKSEYDLKLEHLNRKGELVSLSFQRFKRTVEPPTLSEVPTDPEVPVLQ